MIRGPGRTPGTLRAPPGGAPGCPQTDHGHGHFEANCPSCFAVRWPQKWPLASAPYTFSETVVSNVFSQIVDVARVSPLPGSPQRSKCVFRLSGVHILKEACFGAFALPSAIHRDAQGLQEAKKDAPSVEISPRSCRNHTKIFKIIPKLPFLRGPQARDMHYDGHVYRSGGMRGAFE